MAAVDGLQRHMKGTDRAAVESALDIKEIGAVEDAQQPEGVYKKSDSSGYLHFAFLEWLSSYVDNKGGARLLGVEDDEFSILSGDTNLQALLKAFDTYFNDNFNKVDVVTFSSSTTFDGGANNFNARIKKVGNIIFMDIYNDGLPVACAGAESDILWTPDSNFTNNYAPTHASFHPIHIQHGPGDYEWGVLQVTDSYLQLKRQDSAVGFTAFANVLWQPTTIVYIKDSAHPIIP